MIIARTPFRISLAGGGSDFREYYRRTPGAVLTMAIDKYMYVTVNRRFDDSLRVSYTKTEIVDHVDDLHHDLIRESLKRVGVTKGVEVTTIADLPAGIGLGSSSTLTVGVLQALYALKGTWVSADTLADQACEVEIELLGRPIGKQDQYIAAFGGLQFVTFHPDERVTVAPVVCAREVRDALTDRLMIFYTGMTRDAASVLDEARHRIAGNASTQRAIDGLVELAQETHRALVAGRVDRVGAILDHGWSLKKQMASTVSNGRLDELYSRARAAGAEGGKVSGAGGGGCLLLVVPPERQAAVRADMGDAGLQEVPFGYEPEGSRIVHYHV